MGFQGTDGGQKSRCCITSVSKNTKEGGRQGVFQFLECFCRGKTNS